MTCRNCVGTLHIALLLLVGVPGCGTEGDRWPEAQVPDTAGAKALLTARLPLLLSDGTAARSAREGGLPALAGSFSPEVALLWPGAEARLGFQAVELATTHLTSAPNDGPFWQPLLLRSTG